MLMVIESGEWTNAKGLIDLIKQYGKRLINAKPLGTIILCINSIRIFPPKYVAVDIAAEGSKVQFCVARFIFAICSPC